MFSVPSTNNNLAQEISPSSVYTSWLVGAVQYRQAADVLVLSQSGRAQEEGWIGLLNIALL